jgi:hypothetical protein
MFFDGSLQTQENVQGMFGLAGFGAFAGRTTAADVVLNGTRLRIEGTLINPLGTQYWYISENYLRAVDDWLRKGEYRIINHGASGAVITYDLEVGHDKINLNGILQDFKGSVEQAQTGFLFGTPTQWVTNLRYEFLYDPREHEQAAAPPPIVITPPSGSNQIGDKVTPTEKKSFFDSLQEFFDKKFGFLGGTISGAVLILLGVGALVVSSRR